MSKLVDITFWGLAVACLLNLINFIFYTIDISIARLVGIGVVFLAYFFFTKRRYQTSLPLKCWMLANSLYLLIGMPIRWLYGDITAPIDLVFEIQLFIVSTLTGYVSHHYVLYAEETGKLRKTFGFILVVLLFGCLITVFSPYLGFYNAQNSWKFSTDALRPAGFYLNPNQAGQAACFTLILALGGLMRIRRIRYGLWLSLIALVALATIFITLSRTFMFFSVVFLFVFLLYCSRDFLRITPKIRSTVLLFWVILVVGVIRLWSAFLDISPVVRERILESSNLLSGKIDNQTTANRTGAIQLGLEQIMQHPILGNGVGSMAILKGSKEQLGGEVIGVHNFYLFIWGDAGIFTLLALLAFLYFSFQMAVNLRQSAIRFTIVSFFACYALSAATNHTMQSFLEVSMLVGMASGIITLYLRRA